MAEVTFLPNEYAPPATLIGHPETFAVIRGELGSLEELRDQIEAIKKTATAMADRHIVRLSEVRIAGARAANSDLARCMDALKAEKEARAHDNAALTEQIMAAEAQGRADGMKEAAGMVRAEAERVLALQTGETGEFQMDVDKQLRMTAILLPGLAAAILTKIPAE
jgi:hypothetical protein